MYRRGRIFYAACDDDNDAETGKDGLQQSAADGTGSHQNRMGEKSIVVKTIKIKQCLGRNNIVSLKEENGAHIHDRDRMINMYEEFYTNLCNTTLPQGLSSMQTYRTTINIPPPPFLQTEVSAAIKRLKRGKAPGNDNITVQMVNSLFYKCFKEGKLLW